MNRINQALERKKVRLKTTRLALAKLIIMPHGNLYTPRGYKLCSTQTDASMLAAEAEVALNPEKQAKDASGKPMEIDGIKVKNADLMYWQFNSRPDGKLPLADDEKFEVAKVSATGFDLEAYLNGGQEQAAEEPSKPASGDEKGAAPAEKGKEVVAK